MSACIYHNLLARGFIQENTPQHRRLLNPIHGPLCVSGQDVRQCSCGGIQPWIYSSPWAGMSPNPHVGIHPLLNGEAVHRGLSFDVAAASFAAFQWITPKLSTIISAEKLREAAAYPSVTRLRITHDAIPWWPILINFNDHPATGMPFPTTVGDVLHKIHSELHKQITKQEWDRTSPTQRTIIGRAYTQRYQNAPPFAQVVAANQRVKRVDYLLKKHAFKGLIKAPDEDGVPHWRLVTA